MIKLGGVPVKTRLPLGAWVLAALVTLLSLMPSLLDTARTAEVHEASVTQLLGFLTAF
jgi:hypothetical protein